MSNSPMNQTVYTFLCKHCWEDDAIPPIQLTLPEQIHCDGCGRQLARLSEPVNHHRAIRAGDTVNDYKTGDVLAEIVWDDELVIERD